MGAGDAVSCTSVVRCFVAACAVAALSACGSTPAKAPGDPIPVAATAQQTADPIRVIVTGNLHVAHNSYEDEYGHSIDNEVDAALSYEGYEGTTTSLVVRSHDMSGLTLTLRFVRAGTSDPTVTAIGMWRRDSVPRGAPREGHLDDISGIVLVNTTYVDRADPLICRFFIVGKRNGVVVSVSGAVSVRAPKAQ